MKIPERLLLGPGPSPVAPRVMNAMGSPVLSHLDPDLMAILDDVRSRLAALFRAPDGAFAFAVSGTGTSGMEAAVANVTAPGMRALAAVRRRLLLDHGIEIGAGLGPLAGKIWRVGLMGSGSTVTNVDRLTSALREITRT